MRRCDESREERRRVLQLSNGIMFSLMMSRAKASPVLLPSCVCLLELLQFVRRLFARPTLLLFFVAIPLFWPCFHRLDLKQDRSYVRTDFKEVREGIRMWATKEKWRKTKNNDDAHAFSE